MHCPGSACTSASLEPSYVLVALGLGDDLAHSSLRFSLGRFTTEEEVDFAIEAIRNGVNHMRDLSPIWEMYKDENPFKYRGVVSTLVSRILLNRRKIRIETFLQ